MKSLDQIEARIPISYAGFAINNPGSYYLTTNINGSSGQNGIGIFSGGVTLDLNGFTLQGAAGSLAGVYIAGSYVNITIKNGIINGWGGNGVDVYSAGGIPRSVVFKNLTVTANGNDGLSLADGCTVSDCSVSYNNSIGIFLNGSGSQVIGNTLIGNNAGNNANRAGIFVEGSNNRIEGNHITATGTLGYGIDVFSLPAAILIISSLRRNSVTLVEEQTITSLHQIMTSVPI